MPALMPIRGSGVVDPVVRLVDAGCRHTCMCVSLPCCPAPTQTPASYHASASAHSQVQPAMHEAQIKFVCTSRHRCRGAACAPKPDSGLLNAEPDCVPNVQGTDSQAMLEESGRGGTGQVISHKPARGSGTTARTWEGLSWLW
jgi:hypothetical protein